VLLRLPVFWIVSLGVSALSVVLSGLIFGGAPTSTIGIADADGSDLSARAVQQIGDLPNVTVDRIDPTKIDDEVRDQQFRPILLIPKGFADDVRAGHAQVFMNYNQALPGRPSLSTETIAQIVNQVAGSPQTVDVTQVAVQGELTDRYIDFLVPGMMGSTIMWTGFWGAALIVGWRQAQVLKLLRTTSVTAASLIGATATGLVTIAAVQATIVCLLGVLLFNVHVTGSFLALVVVFLVGIGCMMSIGFALASSSKMGTFAGLLNGAGFLMMFLGGSFLPVGQAPAFLQPVIHAIPLWNLNESLRGVINSGDGIGGIGINLGVLVAWGLPALVLSVWRFSWV
jgi:ABC-2 type transport system permease protein